MITPKALTFTMGVIAISVVTGAGLGAIRAKEIERASAIKAGQDFEDLALAIRAYTGDYGQGPRRANLWAELTGKGQLNASGNNYLKGTRIFVESEQK